MPYAKQIWANGSAGGTPVNANRLNHLESGIEAWTMAIGAAAYPRKISVTGDLSRVSVTVAPA